MQKHYMTAQEWIHISPITRSEITTQVSHHQVTKSEGAKQHLALLPQNNSKLFMYLNEPVVSRKKNTYYLCKSSVGKGMSCYITDVVLTVTSLHDRIY